VSASLQAPDTVRLVEAFMLCLAARCDEDGDPAIPLDDEPG
jgi:hypothetical protein